ncbi:2-(1,2-epoxy-1,2-dihydrophenyl)acetyl-CoA isomerase [Filimonas lacunae]|uniref:2-(1,2-epoxy-1,2-dihydrophenyl)acetyl-CoA isomerase n=1 Tax=Filimonas lacunae TaxID=477680 RepID=A0A173MPG5_9BACT|nr:enoyl-CoA hydratase-related protein [Filimonas lacunae]BAV09357.1 enoyl-CoA hydratase [Filimonas lacunae]SIS71663.1 2-(1,2-epoxy-1,2-dihydrophenyl)acetyl-CoA isomerase [Filimonas lacunae]
MTAKPILFHVTNSVAIITLNRPDKLNAFNREMALLLQTYLDDCADKAIRCVYITGAGKGFSAGQDLVEVTEPDGPGMARILSEHYNPIITRIRNLPKPVIAAVNGVAAGAGANIALACDIVVATASASFIQAFSKIGLIPDSGGTYFLPRLIGHQKASALMMLGDKVSATEAERLGMIYKVIPDESFEAETLQMAHKLAQMATLGLAYTKLALIASAENSLEAQLEKEDELQQKAAASNDFAEGVQAFLEKRAAIFQGH